MRTVFIGIVAVLGAFLLFRMLTPGFGHRKRGYQMISWLNMRQIALALESYRRDHNDSLPRRLSELSPDYVRSSHVLFFESPYSRCVAPTNAASHPELIDVFSPY